jgi:hypothetical protein
MNYKILSVVLLATLFLTGCLFGVQEEKRTDETEEVNHESMGHRHEDMEHNGSPEVPESLEVAKNPKYPVGTKAISIADHMDGMMENVEVTIRGAFDSTVYATTYRSAINGELVEEHKWIIHEEIVDAKEGVYEKGEVVYTTAEHMKGMQDTAHTIDFSEKAIVYMVDFVSTDGQEVSYHKWVIEDELLPIGY